MVNTGVKNKKIPYIIYFAVVFGLFLIAAIVILSIYIPLALESDKEKVVVVYDAKLVSAESDDEPNIPTEYILRQQFDTHGLAISVDGRKIMLNRDDIYKKYVLDVAEEQGVTVDPEADDFKAILESEAYVNALAELEKISVNADLAAAGEKQIEVVYKIDDYVGYRAVIPATVYFVRAVEVTGYPEVVSVSGDVAELDSKFAIYATLGEEPKTDAFGAAEKDGEKGWRIKLNDTMYTQSVSEDTKLKQFYTIGFYCGNLTTGFSFYNAAGRSFIVGATRDVVKYENTNAAGAEELTLVVTNRASSYQRGEAGKTAGSYIYKNGAGAESVIPFAYELTETEELLKSENIEETHVGDSYLAEIDGASFSAEAGIWQSAVVNGNIVDDHGFKAVIGNTRRILKFEYAAEERSTDFPIDQMPESFTVNGSVGDKTASIVCAADKTWTLVFGTAEQNAQIASGTWEYVEGKKAVLTVTDDADDMIVADETDNDGTIVKTVTVDVSTANGTFGYSTSFDIIESETVYEFDFAGSTGTLPSLTLYVTDYDMNPLLGTGNGYSIGKYVYTDANGNSTLINFYMQAWVWTFVPLSSSHGDILSDASVSDFVWDGVNDPDHYNSYFRGTMYSSVTFYDRGNGFKVDNFYAPESLWLNALMNM